MFTRFAPAVMLCIGLALPVAAQDVQALAEEYVALPAVQQMMDAMFSPEAMVSQLSAMMPAGEAISEEQMTKIGALMSERLGALRPSMETAMVASSVATFTPEELQAMVDFHSTEIGASILSKTQPMMSDFLVRVGPEMQAAQQAMMPEIMAIMQE